MQQQGCPLDEIVDEMSRRWGYRPRQAWRHAHGLTQEEVADRYNQLVNDPRATMTDRRISDFEAWPRGGSKPTLTILTNLAQIYGTTSWKLVDQRDRDKYNRHEGIALQPSSGLMQVANIRMSASLESPLAITIDSGNASTRAPHLTAINSHSLTHGRPLSDLIKSAADESRQHAENAQVHVMPEATLEELTADVERLTKDHLGDSLKIFPETVQARDRIYRFLDHQQYPKQTEHLYYLASIVCALLAGTSASVGFPQAALEQARASWAYAEIVGHNSLRLKARMRQATLVDEGDRPQRALDLAISATPWATEPIAKAQLHNSIALYSARTARVDDARSALARAFDFHESSAGDSELFDYLGGTFSYSRAKLLQVSIKTCLELGDTDQAENNATEAINLYENGPSEQRAIGNETSARIDLGHARLMKGDAEGAEDALRPVFQLPPSRRLEWVGLRLKGFHATLRRHDAVTSPLGQRLRLQIEEFFETTASKTFPPSDK
jgi:transcriptional regulator with XRE-family HTH domain